MRETPEKIEFVSFQHFKSHNSAASVDAERLKSAPIFHESVALAHEIAVRIEEEKLLEPAWELPFPAEVEAHRRGAALGLAVGVDGAVARAEPHVAPALPRLRARARELLANRNDGDARAHLERGGRDANLDGVQQPGRLAQEEVDLHRIVARAFVAARGEVLFPHPRNGAQLVPRNLASHTRRRRCQLRSLLLLLLLLRLLELLNLVKLLLHHGLKLVHGALGGRFVREGFRRCHRRRLLGAKREELALDGVEVFPSRRRRALDAVAGRFTRLSLLLAAAGALHAAEHDERPSHRELEHREALAKVEHGEPEEIREEGGASRGAHARLRCAHHRLRRVTERLQGPLRPRAPHALLRELRERCPTARVVRVQARHVARIHPEPIESHLHLRLRHSHHVSRCAQPALRP
mmetsp:Transcript_30753/g.100092  ORF Transcript_30753/g.100092 Transcript_30753/m.100092 type:complete len:408 (+) Transcript_30753:1242-2465(+)